MEITWYIPKSVWLQLDLPQKQALEQVNRNCPYPTTPGLHRTWINTPTFGEFYACRMDADRMEYVTSKMPNIPGMIQEWKARVSQKQLNPGQNNIGHAQH